MIKMKKQKYVENLIENEVMQETKSKNMRTGGIMH